jgi:hypothetical protein
MEEWGNARSNKVLERYAGGTKFKSERDNEVSKKKATHASDAGNSTDTDSDTDSMPRSPELTSAMPPRSSSLKGAEPFAKDAASNSSLLTSASSPHDREHYIRSKYQSLAFVFPNGPISHALPSIDAPKSALPTTFVDYFAVIGTKLERSTFSAPPNLAAIPSICDYPFPPAVIDCYPTSDPKGPNPLPDHISHFVFPNHLKPSIREHPPNFFTIVLTSEKGMKCHAAVMHVWEDVEAGPLLNFIKDLHATDKTPHPPWLDTMNPTDILFMPRSLLVVSHYPFYNCHRQFLQQLYRISLSSAPLPLERYIANFVFEIPLPPKGCVELKYGIADKTITITRPAPNKLPLVDFSFRPLFSTLSLTNILTLWTYLLVENRVAICSKHYSLLTPVCEGLLNLLFPLVWQGAYIPVMPSSMTDILDAPVPFLVGLHSDYLTQNPPETRPTGVIFVDVDRDEVHLGFDESSGMGHVMRTTLSAPEKEMTKLREKLEEHANVLLNCNGNLFTGNGDVLPNTHRDTWAIPATDGTSSARTANNGGRNSGDESSKDRRRTRRDRDKILEVSDLAFPNNEHLLPINHFATEQGMVLQKQGAGRGGIRFKGGTEAERIGLNVEATQLSLIDTALNETGDGFSVKEIRSAFLRFFVSVLRHYDKHVNLKSNSQPFNRDGFMKESSHLNSESHEFTVNLLQSQMFERFIEERISNPGQPEIMFFNESIIQKMNRSATLTRGKKKATPFLSDNSDNVSETFNPPPPSNWGLPDDGRLYSYSNFPSLDPTRFGNVRAPRQLMKEPEQQRTVNESQHSFIVGKMMERSEGSSRMLGGSMPALMGGNTGAGVGGKKGLMPKPQSRDLVWALHLLVYGENLITKSKTAPTTSDMKEANMIIEKQRVKQIKGVMAVLNIQSRSRMKPFRKKMQRMKAAAKFIQRYYRRELILRTYREVYLDVLKIVKIVQKVFRGWLGRVKADKRYDAVLKIQGRSRGALVRSEIRIWSGAAKKVQAAERGRRARFAFAVIRDLVIVAQANVRGWFKRKIADAQRRQRLEQYRGQIFQCWKRAHTPLAYRSKFWLLFDGSGFLHVAVHEDELLRLWRDLGVFNNEAGKKILGNGAGPSTSLGMQFSTLSSSRSLNSDGERDSEAVLDVLNLYSPNGGSVHFFKRFKCVETQLEAAEDDKTAVFSSEIASQLEENSAGSMSGKHLVVAKQRLKLERMQLYEKMKYNNTDTTKSAYYSMFGLKEGDKKKKQRLTADLWESLDLAFESAQVVLGVTSNNQVGDKKGWISSAKAGAGSGALADAGGWVQAKLEKRIKQDLLSTVQACIVSIQSFKVKEVERQKSWRMSGREKYGRFGSAAAGFSPVGKSTDSWTTEGTDGGDGGWRDERREIINRYRGLTGGTRKDSSPLKQASDTERADTSTEVEGEEAGVKAADIASDDDNDDLNNDVLDRLSSASESDGGSSLDWTENPHSSRDLGGE